MTLNKIEIQKYSLNIIRFYNMSLNNYKLHTKKTSISSPSIIPDFDDSIRLVPMNNKIWDKNTQTPTTKSSKLKKVKKKRFSWGATNNYDLDILNQESITELKEETDPEQKSVSNPKKVKKRFSWGSRTNYDTDILQQESTSKPRNVNNTDIPYPKQKSTSKLKKVKKKRFSWGPGLITSYDTEPMSKLKDISKRSSSCPTINLNPIMRESTGKSNNIKEKPITRSLSDSSYKSIKIQKMTNSAPTQRGISTHSKSPKKNIAGFNYISQEPQPLLSNRPPKITQISQCSPTINYVSKNKSTKSTKNETELFLLKMFGQYADCTAPDIYPSFLIAFNYILGYTDINIHEDYQ